MNWVLMLKLELLKVTQIVLVWGKKAENILLYCKILEPGDCDHKLIRKVR